jgi:hypothetical protein
VGHEVLEGLNLTSLINGEKVYRWSLLLLTPADELGNELLTQVGKGHNRTQLKVDELS